MEEKILDIMKEVFEIDNIDNTCSQANCDRWDSLHHLNLIAELEDTFEVEFEPEEIADMNSFDKIYKIIRSKF